MPLLRDPRDRPGVLLTLLPPLWVAAWPHAIAVGLGVWWLGNTVAHHAVHRRLFRAPAAERAFSLWLSLLLGVPQRLWRQRHLAHHGRRSFRPRAEPWLLAEAGALVLAVGLLASASPAFWLGVHLPGVALGLLLAAVHGCYEHRGGTTDCRARWWNFVLLNDGLHSAHHHAPQAHWRDLPRLAVPGARTSRLPPPLRWLADLEPQRVLGALERALLRWPWLQRPVLAAHRRALAAVLAGAPPPDRVVIVGGGLFPRTALLLRELLPQARLVVLDCDLEHLRVAAPWLPSGVRCEHGTFVAGQRLDADLVVLPLAFAGDRERALAAPPAPRVLVHDWWWRSPRPGRSAVVAWWLGKRVDLVEAAGAAAAVPA